MAAAKSMVGMMYEHTRKMHSLIVSSTEKVLESLKQELSTHEVRLASLRSLPSSAENDAVIHHVVGRVEDLRDQISKVEENLREMREKSKVIPIGLGRHL